MSSLATFSPIRPEYTDRPLRFRSASSPWPTDSWISVPPASLDRTTVYVPAGAGWAPTLSPAARRAARDGHDVVDICDVSVRVQGLVAARDSDAGSLVDAGDRVLDALIVEHELEGLVPFPEQLGPVTAA